MSVWTSIKRNALTLWFARKHPDTPLLTKILCGLSLVYVLSPIDLVPDIIPVLGYVDDAFLLPTMMWLAVRLLPPQVMALSQQRTSEWTSRGVKSKNYAGTALLIAMCCLFVYLCWLWL